MKILHIINDLSPRSGGPAKKLKELARHQARAGLDITVFSTNMDYPKGVMDVPTKRPVIEHGVCYKFFPVQFKPLAVSFSMGHQLRRKIYKYDLLHIHGMYRFPATYSAYLSRKRNVPYIIRPHGCLKPFIYHQSSHNIRLKRLYERLFDLPNLNDASAIHFTSAEEKDSAGYLQLNAPKFVVPNGLDFARFDNLPQRGDLRQKLGLAEQRIILFLGRINFVKGLDLLIHSFSEVSRDVDDVVLVIAGPDNDGYASTIRKTIDEKKLTKKVFWTGMLLGTDVLQAYADADVFVLPSYSESFGVTVVEAMASGLPVVISDQVDIWGEVAHSGAGIVVDLNSSKISQALLRILQDKKLSDKMAAAGRQTARRLYSYEHIVPQITWIYEDLIQPRRSSIKPLSE